MTNAPGPAQFLRGRVVGPDHIHDDAVVTIRDGLITAVATPHEWRAKHPGATLPRFSGTLVPGLVDSHCHGTARHSFATTDVAEAERAAAFHHAQGTTSVVASLTPAPLGLLLQQIATLYPLALSGEIAGIHLELPGLDSLPTARMLVEHGEGTVCLVTLDENSEHFTEIVHLLDLSRVCIETRPTLTEDGPSLLAKVREQVTGSPIGLIEAVRAASLRPAIDAGIDSHVGSIVAGRRADILVVDDEITLERVMRDGVWMDEPASGSWSEAVGL
ncbi:MAG: amidohydrolase family protein [Nocardiaceae bacterium]|nr:amidohydrolase family protein [Nocardiaceae bacterium]